MFKELSQMAGLMGKLPKIKEEFAKFQERADSITAEGTAGGDMVRVVANGKMTIVSVRISDEAIKQQDREMLEDLITAAANQALTKVRQLLADEARRVADDIGLPPGLSIPGLT